MNVRAARELLFGDDRARLGEALTVIARENHCSPDSCSGEFQISRVLGSMARVGKSVYFAGNGNGLFQIIYQRRGNTFDDTPYRAHPAVVEILGRFGREATGIGHWARFDFGLGAKTCDNRVDAYDQVVMLEGHNIVGSALYGYSSGLVKVVDPESLDDLDFTPPDEKALAAFRQVVGPMVAELSRDTTQPFAASFAEAVTFLAPGFKL